MCQGDVTMLKTAPGAANSCNAREVTTRLQNNNIQDPLGLP